MMSSKKSKHKAAKSAEMSTRGRPALPMPDTPGNVAKVMLSTPPKAKKDWKFLKKVKAF